MQDINTDNFTRTHINGNSILVFWSEQKERTETDPDDDRALQHRESGVRAPVPCAR